MVELRAEVVGVGGGGCGLECVHRQITQFL